MVAEGAGTAYSQQTEVEITAENANNVQDLLARAESGTIFTLATNLELTSTVSVQNANVTIRGNSRAARAVVRCAEDVDSAFNVR